MDTALIVDVETTGLDAKKDKIIEIAILEFAVDQEFKPHILRCYSGLEDPGFAIPSDITDLTGIRSDAIVDSKIDWDLVKSMFSKASVVIAHNMEFDRGFIKRRQELEGMSNHWACSVKHIPWRRLGFKTRALNYLAADHGFINPFAHRALFDCATTFRLVQPYLQQLIERSYETEYEVWAKGAPFETKDTLKSAGYRWDAEQRCWTKNVLACDLEEERAFLKDCIYAGRSLHVERAVGSD